MERDRSCLRLRTMGSFFFGGTVRTAADGETFHGDHGYAQYYIAAHSRHLPIVLWHGVGQSGRTFESTPDGREGYAALLPRRDWSVYVVDQPRRGRAGRTEAPPLTADLPAAARESGVWEAFRNGRWEPPGRPSLYAGSQFPLSGAAVDQFFRQQTPDTGGEPLTAEYRAFMGQTGAALFRRIGDGILITHSNGGQYGWEIAMASPHVRAVAAYEPGACAFPDDAAPEDVPGAAAGAYLAPRMVPAARWAALTKIPILIVWGDYIPDEPSPVFGTDVWRIARARSRQFVRLVNARGGHAELMELPKLGIRGNTHAAFADRNQMEILRLLTDWLAAQGLDGYEEPHEGPAPIAMPMTLPVEREL